MERCGLQSRAHPGAEAQRCCIRLRWHQTRALRRSSDGYQSSKRTARSLQPSSGRSYKLQRGESRNSG